MVRKSRKIRASVLSCDTTYGVGLRYGARSMNLSKSSTGTSKSSKSGNRG